VACVVTSEVREQAAVIALERGCTNGWNEGTNDQDAREPRPCARYQRLVARWNEGVTYPELMAEFGVTQGHLSKLIHQLRQQGYDLPYRYAAYERKAAA
jgi:hypothetical protein